MPPEAAHARSAATGRADLTERLLDHLALVCVTGEEGPIADAVSARYRHLGETVTRIGHSVVVGGGTEEAAMAQDDRPLVLLVGHLDVVPPTDADRVPHLAEVDGEEVVVGRGASDMKAGNVVAMRLFEDRALRERSPYRLALVLYAGEEGPADGNELDTVLEQLPWLTEAALAVVLEPTDGRVELGCLGGLHAEVTFVGAQAHSARPWHGRNALTLAGSFLAELDDDHVREVEVDGIVYRDVWSATQAWTAGLGPQPDAAAARARNVVPARFTVNLNLRFAPSRTLETAEQELRDRVGDRAEVVVVDRAPPAPPHLGEAIVATFAAAVGAEVAGKQAWTDVARFAQVGVPALNLGPGATTQAHQRGEYARIDALVEVEAQLRRFLDPGAHTPGSPA